LLLATAWVAEPYIVAYWASATSPRPITPRGDLTEAEQTTIKVFRTASPSVVHVFARGKQGFSLFEPEQSVVQSGSGIIWDAAGHVITNNHVISGANEIGTRFPSGELVAARIVGTAPN
jgi:2-alkenal reductase